MNTTQKPQILDNVDALDALATDAVKVPANKLREGMVLMDPELGTPAVWLDHKQRTVRNSGNVQWLAHDLTTGRLVDVNVRASLALAVLAA